MAEGPSCYPKELQENADAGKLVKLMECPICEEVAKPPIFTCTNHHMLCSECRETLTKSECPICKSEVSAHRCVFAEKAMEHMKLPCKFTSDGCKELLKGNVYRDHINTCPMRPIDCVMSKCEEKVPFLKFFEHLLNFHKNKVNGIENTRQHSIEWWIQGSPQNNARWPPYFMTCFNQLFLYMAISTSHGMWEWVWIVGSEEEAKRFVVISKHRSADNAYLELQWRGPVHSIRKTIPEIVESGLCFVTNCKEIRNPFLFRKPDEQNYFYWRTEAEIVQVEPPHPNSFSYIVTNEKTPFSSESPTPIQMDSKDALKIEKHILEQKPVIVSKNVSEENPVQVIMTAEKDFDQDKFTTIVPSEMSLHRKSTKSGTTPSEVFISQNEINAVGPHQPGVTAVINDASIYQNNPDPEEHNQIHEHTIKQDNDFSIAPMRKPVEISPKGTKSILKASSKSDSVSNNPDTQTDGNFTVVMSSLSITQNSNVASGSKSSNNVIPEKSFIPNPSDAIPLGPSSSKTHVSSSSPEEGSPIP